MVHVGFNFLKIYLTPYSQHEKQVNYYQWLFVFVEIWKPQFQIKEKQQ